MSKYDFYDVINPAGGVIDTLCLSVDQVENWRSQWKHFSLIPSDKLTPDEKAELIAMLGDMEK